MLAGCSPWTKPTPRPSAPAFDKGGEQAAALELQQRIPALTIERARAVARMIVGPWPGLQDEPDK
jgi:hypothetical protein